MPQVGFLSEIMDAEQSAGFDQESRSLMRDFFTGLVTAPDALSLFRLISRFSNNGRELL